MKTVSDVFNQPATGHSGTGISYYSNFYKCARRANLQAQHAALLALQQPEGDEDSSVPDARDRGTAYHQLHEAHARLELDDTPFAVDVRQSAYGAGQMAGLRLFRGWRSMWGTLTEKYGATVIGIETLLTNENCEEEIGEPLSGRIDALIHVNDPSAIFARTGLVLPGPGMYMFDHKSVGSRSAYAQEAYAHSPQVAAYQYLIANSVYRGAPFMGSIFDEIVDHKTLKAESFSTYFVPPVRDYSTLTLRLRHYIKGAVMLRDANQCNLAACVSKFEKPHVCPFLGNLCTRE